MATKKYTIEDYAMEAMKMLLKTERYVNCRPSISVASMAWEIAEEMMKKAEYKVK